MPADVVRRQVLGRGESQAAAEVVELLLDLALQLLVLVDGLLPQLRAHRVLRVVCGLLHAPAHAYKSRASVPKHVRAQNNEVQ
eukprot:1659955-Rhodomonas_salina.3